MTGTKKKNRNKKNKSKKPPKGRRPKASGPPQGMTPNIAFNNLDTVCSKFVGTREDHMQLQISIAVLKGKIKALGVAEERIAELEAEISELEAGYADAEDELGADADAADEPLEESSDDEEEDDEDDDDDDDEGEDEEE